MRQLKIATQITNRDDRAVEKYLQEIGKISLLTPEQELDFAIKKDSNNPNSIEYQSAIDGLVNGNLRFVVSVAKQYQHQGLSLSDLINEGNLGLIKAAQRFDQTRGFKFISYAVWRIRQSIMQGLAEQGRIVRLPQNKIGSYNKARQAESAFMQDNEREPSNEELAELLDIDPSDVDNLFASNTKHTSLDAHINEESGDSMTYGDLLTTTGEEISAVFNFQNQDELSESVKHILDLLPKMNISIRDREILLAYFGFGGTPLEALGKQYDLTTERMRQIKERIIKKLQTKTTIKKLLGDNLDSSSRIKYTTVSGLSNRIPVVRTEVKIQEQPKVRGRKKGYTYTPKHVKTSLQNELIGTLKVNSIGEEVKEEIALPKEEKHAHINNHKIPGEERDITHIDFTIGEKPPYISNDKLPTIIFEDLSKKTIGNRTYIDYNNYPERLQIIDEVLQKMFSNKFNRRSHLKKLDITENTKTCIETFIDCYQGARIDNNLSLPLTEILSVSSNTVNKKLMVTSNMFMGYIEDFLNTIPVHKLI